MLKLCEYHLGDHPVDGAEIADIRLGTGHIDLVLDLSRLAKLYQKHKNVVKKDPKSVLSRRRERDSAPARRSSK